MKTPIEELIEWIEIQDAIKGKYPNIKEIQDKATELLEKEKQVIIDAYTKAVANQKHGGKSVTAEQYYKETFKS